MARKPKLKKYPKKPKQSASLSVMQRYIHRVEEIDRENANKVAAYKEAKRLGAKIAGIHQKHHNWGEVKFYKRNSIVKSHKRRVSGVKKRRKKR